MLVMISIRVAITAALITFSIPSLSHFRCKRSHCYSCECPLSAKSGHSRIEPLWGRQGTSMRACARQFIRHICGVTLELQSFFPQKQPLPATRPRKIAFN